MAYDPNYNPDDGLLLHSGRRCKHLLDVGWDEAKQRSLLEQCDEPEEHRGPHKNRNARWPNEARTYVTEVRDLLVWLREQGIAARRVRVGDCEIDIAAHLGFQEDGANG